MAGYAIECALKACIVRRFEGEPGLIFAERDVTNQSWTHDFDKLIKAASVQTELEAEKSLNPQFAANWLLVGKWSEASRYTTRQQAEVDEFFRAVFDDPDGVLTWVMDRW
jgi:hypothetical protein